MRQDSQPYSGTARESVNCVPCPFHENRQAAVLLTQNHIMTYVWWCLVSLDTGRIASAAFEGSGNSLTLL